MNVPLPIIAPITTPILEARNIVKTFPAAGAFGRAASVEALKGVSFSVGKGSALGILGESGSGKSTLARILCGLESADSGYILLDGAHRENIPREHLPHKIQMIFQNPYASLNPKLTVGLQIYEALNASAGAKSSAKHSGGALKKKAAELLGVVGLDGSALKRFPHQLSGGQRQRVAIARALAPSPEIIIADEAVSSLDVSVQAQILNLFRTLRRENRATFIFISHDALAAAYVSDDIIVMKDGSIVEAGEARDIIERPQSDYTMLLVSAAKAS
ncbi:MAG: ABC transporter ATP-binding protein [Endomicrobiia bacterium]|nr:ABC transporter ATP-binding protein [Endomicrobiia bacterium]